MSAFNLVIEPERAIIWTDSAVLDRKDIIVSLETMCLPIEGMPAAVCCFGLPLATKFLATALSNCRRDAGISFDDILEGNGAIVDMAMAAIAHWFEKAPGPPFIWIVGWSERKGAPRCLQFSAGEDPVWAVNDQIVICPDLTEAAMHHLYEQVGPMDGQGFSQSRMGIPLMEAQRLIRADLHEAGRDHHAAGHVLETIITADGVSQTIVHQWQEDVVGAPFRPRMQVPLQEINRAERRQKRGGVRASW